MVKGTHPWYRSRGYLHFDRPVGLKKAESIVTNPQAVARHSFWPLINYKLVTEKVARSATGKLEKVAKERSISYAAHLDSHIYSYYSYLLSGKYERELEVQGIRRHVLAFRSLNKSNIEFARDAFDSIRKFGACGVVAVDISKFFDKIDHRLLKQRWAAVLGSESLPADHYAVFRSLTRYSLVDRDALYEELKISKHNPKGKRTRICSPKEFDQLVRSKGLIDPNLKPVGIPQGSPVSALLSNIYMLDFDKHMAEVVSEWGGEYFRYCDDMLFIVPVEFTGDVEKMVAEEISLLRLEVNENKTEVRTFRVDAGGNLRSDKPLQYLGFLFDGQTVLIRSAAFARFSERMKRGVRLAKLTCYKYNEIRAEKGLPPKVLYKAKLYERYSHLGRRNFISYGLRAAKIMNSKSIRRQLKPLWRDLQDAIHRTPRNPDGSR